MRGKCQEIKRLLAQGLDLTAAIPTRFWNMGGRPPFGLPVGFLALYAPNSQTLQLLIDHQLNLSTCVRMKGPFDNQPTDHTLLEYFIHRHSKLSLFQHDYDPSEVERYILLRAHLPLSEQWSAYLRAQPHPVLRECANWETKNTLTRAVEHLGVNCARKI